MIAFKFAYIISYIITYVTEMDLYYHIYQIALPNFREEDSSLDFSGKSATQSKVHIDKLSERYASSVLFKNFRS